jgi:hypothetical protein
MRWLIPARCTIPGVSHLLWSALGVCVGPHATSRSTLFEFDGTVLGIHGCPTAACRIQRLPRPVAFLSSRVSVIPCLPAR